MDKKRRKFRAGTLKWISGSPPENSQLQCKVKGRPFVLFMLNLLKYRRILAVTNGFSCQNAVMNDLSDTRRIFYNCMG